MDELLNELLACLIVVVFLVICGRIISCCRNSNDESHLRRPILVSSSRNVPYTQTFRVHVPVKSAPTIPAYNDWHGHSRPFQASSSRNVPYAQAVRGVHAPVKSTPIIPAYNDRHGHSRPFQASSSHNIPKSQDFDEPTRSTVKILTIPEHGRNVSSTSRIPPPSRGPSSITVLSNVLLSGESENVTHEEDLREKARRMIREVQEARNLAKQAHKRRNFSAQAMYKQNARVLECTIERLNKEAATAIFNQKNKSLPDGTVDLHGLYVPEALEYAKKEFQSVVLRSDKVVRFIVGKGLHAKDGKVKIRPALEKLCKLRGFTYHLDPKNSGILIVQC